MSKRKRDENNPTEATDVHDPLSPPFSTTLDGSLRPSKRKSPLSYVDTEVNPTPAGPYSYFAESRDIPHDTAVTTDHNEHGEDRGGAWKSKGRRKDSRREPRVDARTGQMGAFPEPARQPKRHELELEDGEMDDGADQDDEDIAAWEYLRSVRQEAEALPSIKSARPQDQRQPHTHDDKGDTNGNEDDHDDYDDYEDYEQHDDDTHGGAFFSDGAWIARPLPPGQLNLQNSLHPAQEAYYLALHKRFARHRARDRALRSSTSPGHAPHPLSIRDLFRSSLRHGEPSLALLGNPSATVRARLDGRGALALLDVLAGDVEHYYASPKAAGKAPSAVLGQWAWLLLSRVSDVGELGSEEVGAVRSLGKTAGAALCRMRAGGSEGGKDEDGGEGQGLGLGQAMALLHLVITVAGEFYGQADLLASRLPWSDT